MRHLLHIFLLGMVVMAFSACNSDIIYSHFSPISSNKWHIDSVAHFDFTVEDATPDYRVLVYVRHTERYPYQNMWLFVDDGLYRDTLEFYLADDRGQWLGDRKHGFIEMPVLLEENKHFADTGVYHYSIQHAMRDTLLRGVTDVGLEIRRVNSGKE